MLRTILFYFIFFLYMIYSLMKKFKLNKIRKTQNEEEAEDYINIALIKWAYTETYKCRNSLKRKRKHS